jgi:hypothetical protein
MGDFGMNLYLIIMWRGIVAIIFGGGSHPQRTLVIRTVKATVPPIMMNSRQIAPHPMDYVLLKYPKFLSVSVLADI